MHTFEYEYTDTFGGEANYCWVKRGTRQVKEELGLTGVRGVRETWGDIEVFKPYRSNTILFVEFKESNK